MHTTRRTILKSATASAVTAIVTGCTNGNEMSAQAPPKRLMINGNIVIPFKADGPLTPSTVDLVRKAGLSAGKVSIGGSSGTYEETHTELDNYDKELGRNSNIYLPVTSVDDIRLAYETNRFGIIKSFEAATMLGDDVSRVAEFAARGVKIMQLGYNNTSLFGAGVISSEGDLKITELGVSAIAEMESKGVLLDLSHAHEETMRGAMEASTKPIGVTHTGCDALNPHPRNKSDDILKQVANQGGVVGIYELSYLTPELAQTPLSAYMAHLAHALDVCGEDHVGIGSDALLWAFDTSPESKANWDEITRSRQEAGIAAPGEGPMPFVVGLNGPQRMWVIERELKKLGYKDAALDKILGRNFLRLFGESWSV